MLRKSLNQNFVLLKINLNGEFSNTTKTVHNKIKYHCKKYYDNWDRTNTFDKVHKHEQIHLEKIEVKTNKDENNVITL